MSFATVFAEASPVVPPANEIVWTNVVVLLAVVVVALCLVRAIFSARRKRQGRSASLLNDPVTVISEARPTSAAQG